MTKRTLFYATAGWLALGASSVSAQQVDDAARFGALPQVEQVSLSPGGTKVSLLTRQPDGRSLLAVIDTETGGDVRGILSSPSADENLYHCDWATDTRLVCGIAIQTYAFGKLMTFTRPLAVNADGSKVLQLLPRGSDKALGVAVRGGELIDFNTSKPGHVLMTRVFVPESSTGSLVQRNEQGVGVEDVDVTSGARRIVEHGRKDARSYISDGLGNVRIMGQIDVGGTGMMTGRSRYYYRTADDREWKPLSEAKEADYTTRGFIPEAVDAKRNVVYGFDADQDGFTKLYSIALDGSARREVVLSRPGIDVDSIVTFGRTSRVVGASYATERRMVEYSDPELRKLSMALSKALPGNPAISFIDASADENKIVILAGSDTNPGVFYLYDKQTHHLGEIAPYRPNLVGAKLAEMKPISFPAADGTMIPGYLTLPLGSTGKNLPAIVMPHGGPSARDEWGFDWLVQFFAARGYAVLQPNYRGSSGYGADWYQHNGFKSWKVAIDDVDDAGRWLTREGIAAPGKLAIVGWSYGGYAALQSQVVDPDLYKAVVAVAPVTDLDAVRDEASGFTNYGIIDQAIGRGPHIENGSPARHADRFKAPVLLFHGDRDENVSVSESRMMKNRLQSAGKQVEYVEFSGLDHQLPDAAARTRLLSTSDAFLRKALKIE
ncbi:S9 family peptidase [Novosphingobium resinovorum]|uniref:S9 family peptidase n=1 Tax=Novosphingobium resinovorum TaxID=158500 RepID=UPI002ED00C3B|nr:S9 family peptidase [Novosphingobium resinovorum]